MRSTDRTEGLPRIKGEDDENSLTILVVVLSDSLVLVLSSSIPDLYLDLDLLYFDDLEDIVYADGHHVVIHELILAIPKQDVALPHSRVPDYYHFLQVIETLCFLFPTLCPPHF